MAERGRDFFFKRMTRRRAHGSQSSNEYCCPAASRLPGGSTRLARRAPAALPLAAAPAAAALAAAALAGERYDRWRPLHPRLPSRAPSRRPRAELCWHTARVVTQPRRTGGAAREARAISYFQGWIRPFQGYTFENPPRPTLLVTLSISRLANTKSVSYTHLTLPTKA